MERLSHFGKLIVLLLFSPNLHTMLLQWRSWPVGLYGGLPEHHRPPQTTADHHRPMPNDHRRPFLHHRPPQTTPVKTEWWDAGIVVSGSRCRIAYGTPDATATHYLVLQ